jgi:hypothetical protein
VDFSPVSLSTTGLSSAADSKGELMIANTANNNIRVKMFDIFGFLNVVHS